MSGYGSKHALRSNSLAQTVLSPPRSSRRSGVEAEPLPLPTLLDSDIVRELLDQAQLDARRRRTDSGRAHVGWTAADGHASS